MLLLAASAAAQSPRPIEHEEQRMQQVRPAPRPEAQQLQQMRPVPPPDGEDVHPDARTFQPGTFQAVPLATWDFPFKGEDFSELDKIYRHRPIHGTGVQKHGYDVGVRRWDADAGRWLGEFSGDGKVNGNWFIYGKPVYAMQDGKVIACWRNAPENPRTGIGPGNHHEELTRYGEDKTRIYGGGNGFWIEHADGTRAEYAHFQPGTVPTELCPHDDELMPVVIDSPNVRDAWPHIRVPPGDQKTVKRGQFLGRVGNAGTSSNPHLHIHREEGGQADTEKKGGTPVEFRFRNGLYIEFGDEGPYTEWQSFSGGPIPPGPVLVWPPRTVGQEHARHGYPVEQFGALFQHLADSGFQPSWLDFYSVGGRTYVNLIWRKRTGRWRAYFGVNHADFQRIFDENKAAQFAPTHMESYLAGSEPRYAAIFVHQAPGRFRARHGVSRSRHIDEMNAARADGLAPVSVAVVPAGGQVFYTALYRSSGVSDWVIVDQVAESAYQGMYDRHSGQGRKPIAVNGYMTGDTPTLAAVFGKLSTGPRRDRHRLSGTAYQREYESALRGGMLTRTVTAFDGARREHRYTASWWQ